MRQRGWIERECEPRPLEGRVLITLWHPRQTLGEGADRYVTAVETFRSLPLDAPTQLSLFERPLKPHANTSPHQAPAPS